MESEPILKKTLYTVAVMLAAWIVFIGTLSVVAVACTSRAVAPPEGREAPGLDSKPSLGSVPVAPGKGHPASGKSPQSI